MTDKECSIKKYIFACLTYINEINVHITSILLIKFWYYWLAFVANIWKQTHQERYLHMPLLPNPHAITDLCINLKMYVTIGNRGLIWKYERYARKSPNNATTNQTNLKTLTRGEWLSGLRRCKWIGRFLVQNLIGACPDLGSLTYYEVPSDL